MGVRLIPTAAVALTALALVTGCELERGADPTGVVPQADLRGVEGRLDHDGHMAQLARDLPGFAGHYADGEVFVVRMSGEGHPHAIVRTAVRDLMERLHPRANDVTRAFRDTQLDRMVVLPAEYDFAQLHAWYHVFLREVWPTGAVRYSDIDERENRIQIAARSEEDRAQIAAELEGLGVPPEAVQLGTMDPIRPLASLTSNVTNEVGGVKIEAFGNSPCTLGFVTDYSGDSKEYLITASHCTKDLWDLDGMNTYQPTEASGNIVAKEVSDPDPFTNAQDTICPSSYDCRKSDAALLEFTSGSPLVGEVAFAGLGSTTYSSTIWILDEYSPSNGDYVEVVGQVSGRATSEVVDTCVRVEDTSTRVYTCGYLLEDSLQGGDSGGPVMHWFAPLATDRMHAVGIVQAFTPPVDFDGDSLPAGTLISGMDEILDELEGDFGGTLSTEIYAREDPNISFSSGPYTMPSGLLCSWTVSVSGGVPGYSVAWTGQITDSGTTGEGIINSSGTIKATVTDAVGHTAFVTRYITIDNNAPEPSGCSEEQQ